MSEENNVKIMVTEEEPTTITPAKKCCFQKCVSDSTTEQPNVDCSACNYSWHPLCREKYFVDASLNDLLVTEHCAICYSKRETQLKQLEFRKNYIAKMVTRQTTYTVEQAREKLEEYKYNVTEVIKNFMSPDKKTRGDEIREEAEAKKTTNQKIYTEFRNLLDTSAEIMKRRRELETKVNETYEKMMAAKTQQSTN
jgi:hypothetical protein